NTEYTFSREVGVIDQLAPIDPRVLEDIERHIRAEQREAHERQNNDWQHQSNHAPRGFEDDGNQQGPEDDINRRGCSLAQSLLLQPNGITKESEVKTFPGKTNPKRCRGAGDTQHPILNGYAARREKP